MPLSVPGKFLLRRWREDKKSALDTNAEDVSVLVHNALRGSVPFMAARGGWMESYAAGVWLSSGFAEEKLLKKLHQHAGIFPPCNEQLAVFVRLYLDALAAADLLGLLQSPYEGWLLSKTKASAKRCRLSSLEPYLSVDPWSAALEGRKVLVVHPFADSIAYQYRENRQRLFADPRVLPRFELSVAKAPQTMCGGTAGFESWSHAFSDLSRRVGEQDFDVAIVGCGAYGLPLAAHIKSKLGKAVVHLGGATQLLFGVSGARWRNRSDFSGIINKWWRQPSESERPAGWQKIEDGCYW